MNDETMKRVSEKESKKVRGGVTAYSSCPICKQEYSGWSLFGAVAFWEAQGKAKKCMYSHYDNL